ncbi:hypothetical protein SAMN05216548_11645 [Faunimonas pinastri]|uniref:Uncharacterized protein n=1 Tax=Faunimonas pinastri TaxID=1855383 RepID=A0A1H9NKM0_9HYPH|nr:hypothetical protein [Faunimonas pinastri]SER36199.1 hypothetical protein SAMN05216548_11645 [Faunimonas pinastri]
MLKTNLDQLNAVRRHSLAVASKTAKERLALNHLEDLRQQLAQALDRPGSSAGHVSGDCGAGLHRR